MIHIKGNEITGVHFAGRAMTAVYHGAKLVWQAVESVWRRAAVWRGREAW